MLEDFSIVSVVLFIAFGALIGILLLFLAKRQIMRFALKSAQKPHVTIGSDAPKILRDKIHQCLEMTKGLCFDPILLSEEVQNMAQSNENHYYYRMKALDAFSNAVTTLQWSDSSVPKREAKHTIQLYLYWLCPSAAGSKEAVIIEKFAQAYKYARHSANIFGEAAFIRYMELLDKVIRLIKLDQKRRSQAMKAVNLEVFVKSDGKSPDIVTQVTNQVEIIPLQPLAKDKSETSPVSEERKNHHNRDFSSGYSSTDRSSSGHGSEERLIANENKHV